MFEQISSLELGKVCGGADGPKNWADIRAAAAPHCPNTVAAYPNAPKSRAEAQAMGDACIAEMGRFKAAMGGRSKIQAGIDKMFPQ